MFPLVLPPSNRNDAFKLTHSWIWMAASQFEAVHPTISRRYGQLNGWNKIILSIAARRPCSSEQQTPRLFWPEISWSSWRTYYNYEKNNFIQNESTKFISIIILVLPFQKQQSVNVFFGSSCMTQQQSSKLLRLLC